jgi:hypothetical protein
MQNYSWKQFDLKNHVIQKTNNQRDHVPRYVKNDLKNYVYNPANNYYPSSRPLKHYRRTGTSNSNNTDQSYSTPKNCNPFTLCENSIRVGKPFKMIGKKDKTGELYNKACNGTPQTGTIPPTYGNIASFSGIANIRRGLLNKTKTTLGEPLPGYYFNYSTYLKKRGVTYETKSTFHPIPGVDYSLPPDDTPNDSSHYYENNITESPGGKECENKCDITIYKPSNPSFSTQGPVDCSAFIDRQKYNAIVTNNASFLKPWGLRLPYKESPIFILKNNNYVCKRTVDYYTGKFIPF